MVLGRAAGIVMDNTGRSEGNTGSSGSRYKVQRLQRAQIGAQLRGRNDLSAEGEYYYIQLKVKLLVFIIEI